MDEMMDHEVYEDDDGAARSRCRIDYRVIKQRRLPTGELVEYRELDDLGVPSSEDRTVVQQGLAHLRAKGVKKPCFTTLEVKGRHIAVANTPEAVAAALAQRAAVSGVEIDPREVTIAHHGLSMTYYLIQNARAHRGGFDSSFIDRLFGMGAALVALGAAVYVVISFPVTFIALAIFAMMLFGGLAIVAA